jgi:hypothetical protein
LAQIEAEALTTVDAIRSTANEEIAKPQFGETK